MDEPVTDAPNEEPIAAETAETSDAPPWGEDFDPERAWNTIQTQRAEAKELKQSAQRARELEAQWDDEDAHFAFLANRGYQFGDDEEDDLDLYEDEGPDPTIEELKAVKADLAELRQDKAEREFNADLSKLAKAAEVTLSERDRKLIQHATNEGGGNPSALKKAFEQWDEERKAYETEVIERYRESKKAPHVSKVGKQATDTPDYENMSRSDRVKAMAERVNVDRQQ